MAQIKDSGKREAYDGGMVRDTTEGKVDYLLTRDGPMFRRWAEHLTNGAKKYAKRNWMLAKGQAEYDRAKESAARHFEQWLRGDNDEDHAAAVFFNINEAEYILDKIGRGEPGEQKDQSPQKDQDPRETYEKDTRKQCRKRKISISSKGGDSLAWVCTRTKGHSGKHHAHYNVGDCGIPVDDPEGVWS